MFDYELAGCLTEDNYEAAIPACCAFQGYEAHANGLMLCWGLVAAIGAGERMDCTGCDLARRNSFNVEFRPLDAASSRPVAPGTQG